MTMRYLKISAIFLVSVYTAFLLRNIILHTTYKHFLVEDEIVYKKVTRSEGFKEWRFEIETHYNLYDELHVTEYILNSDSTGVATYRRFKRKVLGVDRANLYSWASLLPYKKNEPIEVANSRFEFNDSTILHLEPLPPFRNDSVIADYNIRNGDLVVTSYTDSKDPFEYETNIPYYQSSPIPFKRLIPIFSELILRVKQGNKNPIPE